MSQLLMTGDVVYKKGKIFEAGYYPDKRYGMTEDELVRAKQKFKPVDLDIEHMPTIFDGKLGKLVEVDLSPDRKVMYGTVAIPRWLDDALGNQPITPSVTWLRDAKEIARLALVKQPRIPDAVLFSAFSNGLGIPENEVVQFWKQSETITALDSPNLVKFEPIVLTQQEKVNFSTPLAQKSFELISTASFHKPGGKPHNQASHGRREAWKPDITDKKELEKLYSVFGGMKDADIQKAINEHVKTQMANVPSFARSNIEYGMKRAAEGKSSEWVNKFGYQLEQRLTKMMETDPDITQEYKGGKRRFRVDTPAGSLQLIAPEYKTDPYKMSYQSYTSRTEYDLAKKLQSKRENLEKKAGFSALTTPLAQKVYQLVNFNTANAGMGTKSEQKDKAEKSGKKATGWQRNVGKTGVYRSEIKSSDFVMPDVRKFPVVTPNDVQDAVQAWGMYKGDMSFETFKKRLIALAKRKGDAYYKKLPKAWLE
jgi:hypothetical protein